MKEKIKDECPEHKGFKKLYCSECLESIRIGRSKAIFDDLEKEIKIEYPYEYPTLDWFWKLKKKWVNE